MNSITNIVFLIICESSIDNHEACITSIKALRNVRNDIIIDFFYLKSDENKSVLVSNGYINNLMLKKYNYVFVVRDSVCIIEELLIKKIMDIFKFDLNIGVLGIKGYLTLENYANNDNVYGACYKIDTLGNPVLERYRQPIGEVVEVELITGNFVVFRGDIPLKYDITMEIFAEMVSAAAIMQGYKIVVPKQNTPWCLETDDSSSHSLNSVARINKEFSIARFLVKQEIPLLTIGIPTYNRSKYLNKCLEAIYNQISNYPFVEVIVSDNCSTDDTSLVVGNYKTYKNFRYICQSKNIGAEKNVLYLYENANGKFVIVCGDDDYYMYGTIMRIIETVYKHPYTALIGLSWWGNSYEICSGNGVDEFLRMVSRVCTSISSVAINRMYYMEISNRNRFGHTSLNQVYIQLAMLIRHRLFCYVEGANFGVGSGEALAHKEGGVKLEHRMDYCKVFIDQYYEILKYFCGKGLSLKGLYEEMDRNIARSIGWLRYILQHQDHISYRIDDDMEDIIEKYYSKKKYYKQLVDILAEIRSADTVYKKEYGLI